MDKLIKKRICKLLNCKYVKVTKRKPVVIYINHNERHELHPGTEIVVLKKGFVNVTKSTGAEIIEEIKKGNFSYVECEVYLGRN